jgi:UDP-N-acetylmuramoylalanine--D-glutamate ligase
MKGSCAPFEGKKVTVMGLGLLGRGVGDAEFLAKCGAEVLVTDRKSGAELAGSVATLRKYPNVSFKLGRHDIDDFKNRDLVIKAAGVPLDSPEIAAARAAHVPVVMSTALFSKYAAEAGTKIVGITGTRGKTTVAHMIFHALKKAGRKVCLGGNVRGISTLAMLPEVEKESIAVLELDSWQLQGFGDLEISPNISLFTNLMPDHQNYYSGMETYFADKANIFRFQKQGNTLIVGKSVLGKIQASRPKVAPRVPSAIPADWKLKIIGEHNRENASFAVAALAALGLSNEQIKDGLESFEPVEGRLQFVREINGVKIYNDNNATTPEATIAALRALGHSPTGQSLGRGITLIVGGSEKDLSLDKLVSEIQRTVSHVILLTHADYKGSARLAEVLKKERVQFQEADNLREALATAVKNTKTGSVLFSPAFASFGMFRNEYDRNDQFAELVRQLDADA